MTLQDFFECDACGEVRPCCVPVHTQHGDGNFCHKCRNRLAPTMPECEDCAEYDNPTDTSECENCGFTRHSTDGREVQTYAGTYMDPPEYGWICLDCLESDEAARDHAVDQKIDAMRDGDG